LGEVAQILLNDVTFGVCSFLLRLFQFSRRRHNGEFELGNRDERNMALVLNVQLACIRLWKEMSLLDTVEEIAL
jgi:hypothetical protein